LYGCCCHRLFEGVTTLYCHALTSAFFVAHDLDASWLAAFRICEHDVRDMQRHRFVHDLTFARLTCTAMLFHEVDTVEKNHVSLGQDADDGRGLTLVLACDHYYFVTFFEFHNI